MRLFLLNIFICLTMVFTHSCISSEKRMNDEPQVKRVLDLLPIDTFYSVYASGIDSSKLFSHGKMGLVILNDSDIVYKKENRYFKKNHIYHFAIGFYDVKEDYTRLFNLTFPGCEIFAIDSNALRFSIKTPINFEMIEYEYSVHYPYLLVKENGEEVVLSGLNNEGKMYLTD